MQNPFICKCKTRIPVSTTTPSNYAKSSDQSTHSPVRKGSVNISKLPEPRVPHSEHSSSPSSALRLPPVGSRAPRGATCRGHIAAPGRVVRPDTRRPGRPRCPRAQGGDCGETSRPLAVEPPGPGRRGRGKPPRAGHRDQHGSANSGANASPPADPGRRAA